MLSIAGEVRTNSEATYGLLHVDTPLLADQQKLIFISRSDIQ